MSFTASLFSKLKRFFLAFFGVFRRAICCRKRSRRNSGMLLPVTVDKKNDPVLSRSYLNSGSAVNYNFQQGNINQNTAHSYPNTVQANQAEVQAQEEPDYFKDMTPQFKRPKKVILATNEEQSSVNRSSRLDFDARASISQETELGAIEDTSYVNSWEDEVEGVDPDAALRDMRQAEREKRIAQHQRIKMEKELKRAKAGQKNLVATKIS